MLTVNSVETSIIERLELDFKKQNVCSESIAAMRYTLLGRNNRKANKQMKVRGTKPRPQVLPTLALATSMPSQEDSG